MARKQLSEQMAFPQDTVLVDDEKLALELSGWCKIYDETKPTAQRFQQADREITRRLAQLPAVKGPTCFALSESGPFLYIYTDKVDRAGRPNMKGATRIRKQVAMEREATS